MTPCPMPEIAYQDINGFYGTWHQNYGVIEKN